MTKSVTKIQDRDSNKRLSVVRSTADPTKYGVVILNPDGSKISGPKGDAATVDVGSTTTGLPGTNASVVNSGTTSDAVLDFTIPRGDKGDKGDTGTIAVGSTTTGDAGTCACVTNSGTCTDAVFNFTIPKGDKGDTGGTGTISVGSTTTGNPGTCACVTNSGTSTAAVFNFTIPEGEQGETGNGIASVTSSKAGKVTTVTITDTNGCCSCFTVCDGSDGEGAGDVLGPNVSVGDDIVLFDGNTGKLIKDSGKSLSDYQEKLTPGDNITICNNNICANAQVSNDAYSCDWDGVCNLAPSQDAVYDKIESVEGEISDLGDRVDDLSALGKFLSLWDSSTGLPISFPQDTPYTYSTGDYYLVETVDSTTNYRPTGSSYTGTASTTVETDEVDVGDLYIYDGSVWLLQINHGKSVSFANLAGVPNDNACLCSALDSKADNSCVVHLAGSETITGQKTFSCTTRIENSLVVATNNTQGIDVQSTATGGYLYVTRCPGANQVQMAIKAGTSGGTFGTTTAHQFQFRTNDVARMTVQSTGQGGKVELASGSIPTAGDCSCLVPSTSWVQGEITSHQPGCATSSCLGLVKLGSDTVQSVSAEAVSGCSNRTYAIQTNASGQAVVNVPWQNTQCVTSVNGCTGAVSLSIPTDNCQLLNGCGYTTCTGTLVPSNIACINGCCLTNGGNITITGGISNDTTCTTSTVTGIWAGTEAEYGCIGTKCGSVLYFTF